MGREGMTCFLLQAEDGIRDLVRSRGLGDVYKRQRPCLLRMQGILGEVRPLELRASADFDWPAPGSRQEYLRARLENDGDGLRVRLYPNQSSGVLSSVCLLYTSPSPRDRTRSRMPSSA